MIHQFETFQLEKLLAEAAELGAKRALTDLGLAKPMLKKAEAYKLYGRETIERWINEGLLTVFQDGYSSSTRLDRAELDSLAKSNNWPSYRQTSERRTMKPQVNVKPLALKDEDYVKEVVIKVVADVMKGMKRAAKRKGNQ